MRGPSHETRLQFVQRIGDAYGLVLVLILTTFVVTMTLPPQGWVGRVAAVAIAGLTAIIALTSSDVPLGRVRFAAGAALAAVLATALGRAVSSDALLVGLPGMLCLKPHRSGGDQEATFGLE